MAKIIRTKRGIDTKAPTREAHAPLFTLDDTFKKTVSGMTHQDDMFGGVSEQILGRRGFPTALDIKSR